MFDAEKFRAGIYDETWEARPLKNRVRHIAMTLRGLLPDDYRSALNVLAYEKTGEATTTALLGFFLVHPVCAGQS